jgi:hypothetical protein
MQISICTAVIANHVGTRGHLEQGNEGLRNIARLL